MSRGKKQKTNEQFIKEVEEKYGNVYNFLELYVNADTSILIEHKCPDGDYHTWKADPSYLLSRKNKNNNPYCPKCSGLDTGMEAFKRKVYNKYGDEYIVVGNIYKNRNTPVLLEHNVEGCHCQFEQIPDSLLFHNTGCPDCSPISKAEDIIKKLFIEHSIEFKSQKTFPDLKYVSYLRFDFAVYSDKKHKDLKLLLEYQGEQHYKPCTFRGISKEKAEIIFKENKIKDQIKRDYCNMNNIKLLEIPYWDINNIEAIIRKELSFII